MQYETHDNFPTNLCLCHLLGTKINKIKENYAVKSCASEHICTTAAASNQRNVNCTRLIFQYFCAKKCGSAGEVLT